MREILQGKHEAKGLRIGVVTARFNSEITERLETAALEMLHRLGCEADHVHVVRVPGAVEIPLAAQTLLETGCDGVVALGAVIRGETTHYESVCNAVERGCMDVQLRLRKPIGFGVLTTENDEQALDRAGGKHGNKGAEAAAVTVEMIQLQKKISGR